MHDATSSLAAVQMTVNGQVGLPAVAISSREAQGAQAVTGDKRWPEPSRSADVAHRDGLSQGDRNYELRVRDRRTDRYLPQPPGHRAVESRASAASMIWTTEEPGCARRSRRKLGHRGPIQGQSVKNFSDFIAEVTPRWKEIVRITGIKVGG